MGNLGYPSIQWNAKQRRSIRSSSTKADSHITDRQVTKGYIKYDNVYIKFKIGKTILGGESTAKTNEHKSQDIWEGGWLSLTDLRASWLPVSGNQCPVLTLGPWPHGCVLLLSIFNLHIWVKVLYY